MPDFIERENFAKNQNPDLQDSKRQFERRDNFEKHTKMFTASSCQRFALPALGRAAGRRPTGKRIRRRKMLGIAPDSPASGARFVRRGLPDKCAG